LSVHKPESLHKIIQNKNTHNPFKKIVFLSTIAKRIPFNIGDEKKPGQINMAIRNARNNKQILIPTNNMDV
jgi:hypothetical protein